MAQTLANWRRPVPAHGRLAGCERQSLTSESDLIAMAVAAQSQGASRQQAALSIGLLGEIELVRGGKRIALPPSKKTRALLGYLVATGRPHRRERLCTLLWEIPDDPRGALRWSLSKIRRLLGEDVQDCLVATRETVAFEANGVEVDLLVVRQQARSGLEALSTERLAALADFFRGEFLEGNDLPHLHEFEAWCLAEREDLRILHGRILSALADRLSGDPSAALRHVRKLVEIDPYNEQARTDLLRILHALGRRTEAEQHVQSSVRVLQELGSGAEAGLLRVWQDLRRAARPAASAAGAAQGPGAKPAEAASVTATLSTSAGETPLVGRQAEWRRIVDAMTHVVEREEQRIVLLSGEPGHGKSRLLSELVREAQRRNFKTIVGRGYETDRDHPYGPWLDALGHFPAPACGEAQLTDSMQTAAARDQLFSEVADIIFGRGSTAPALIVLDDVHWLDKSSAGLLHYLIRTRRRRACLIALAARQGELAENAAMIAVLRGLRRDGELEELELTRLTQSDTEELVRAVAPQVDTAKVVAQSGGNPLFALELARSLLTLPGELPRSLRELVRDRLDRLPAGCADLLRWASILGPSFSSSYLTPLVPSTIDDLVASLEILERHGLLRAADPDSEPGGYHFAHELVHRAVYTGISEPRRRLMHMKVSHALREIAGSDERLSIDIAHHAAMGGDPASAASACVSAGRRCLRLFANAEAEALARRGLHHAEPLAEPERVQRRLELIQIELSARRPADPVEVMQRIESLADQALDYGCVEHARLGFHMLSHLRWESGLWADARRDTLRAQLVSRSADEKEHVVATAEAARCLAMLERDLGDAEALLLEAKALAKRLGIEPNAIADAGGLLRRHEGAAEEAAELFQSARTAARLEGDRQSEFLALEHLTMLRLEQGRFSDAEVLCERLSALAGRLREGSEVPFARALEALCRVARGARAAEAELEAALESVRIADAKHRLGSILLCAAEMDLQQGKADVARFRAEEALNIATLLERASDTVLAQALLLRVATVQGDDVNSRRYSEAIRQALKQRVSAHAQAVAQSALGTTTSSIPSGDRRRTVRVSGRRDARV